MIWIPINDTTAIMVVGKLGIIVRTFMADANGKAVSMVFVPGATKKDFNVD